MIRINLLPIRELKAQLGRRQQLTIAGLSLCLIVALLVGLHLFQLSRISRLEVDLAGLQGDIAVVNKKVKGVESLRRAIGDLKNKINVIEELTKNRTGPVQVMENLSSAIPARLWLTEFKESGGNLNANGMAVDNQTIATFLDALSSSPFFQDVELVESTHVDANRAPLKKFAMTSRLSYRPREEGRKK
jgi:type IV pilus assembly protein PilN